MTSFPRFSKIPRIAKNSEKNFSIDLLSYYVLLIQSGKIGQKFFSFENFDNSKNFSKIDLILKNFENIKNLTSFPRNAEILRKISRPPVNIFSPDTKSQNWPKIFFIRKFRKFQELLKILRKISRSTSYHIMFS